MLSTRMHLRKPARGGKPCFLQDDGKTGILRLGLSSALAVVLSGGGLRPCWGGPKLFGKTKIGKLIFPQNSTIQQEN